MARQQEVGDTFLDSVLVATVLANQLTLLDLCLQEEVVKILQGLGILLKGLSCGRLLRQLRETELFWRLVFTTMYWAFPKGPRIGSLVELGNNSPQKQ